MSSVSKLGWLFCRAKHSLLRSVGIHPSLAHPGVVLSNLHLSRITVSLPSTSAAVSSILLSGFCAATLVSEKFDESGEKSSWISRSTDGLKLGNCSRTHCDATAVNASHFGKKDRSKTPVLTATTVDATEIGTQRNYDKIQRRVSRSRYCFRLDFSFLSSCAGIFLVGMNR
jgi:hypothetical protein